MKNNFKNLAIVILTAAALGLTGCGDSREDFVITQPQAAAPVAVDDTVTALGNATLIQAEANGVLPNDTPNNGGISAFDAVSTQGAAVVLNADGSFNYTPVFGFTGVDTFTYTLTNSGGSSTATVTVNVPNSGFFVNNQAPNGGNGSQASPFNILNDAVAAAGSGDIIYVFRGDGTAYPGGFNLPDGVSLIGESQGLVVAQQIEPAGQTPEVQGTITCLGNNTISGFLISGNSDAIEGNGISNLTLTNNTLRTDDDANIDLVDIGGTVLVSGNTFESTNDNNAMDLFNTDTNVTVNITNNTYGLLAAIDGGDGNGDDAASFNFSGSSVATITANGNTLNGTGTDGLGDNLESGFQVLAANTAQITMTADNNIFNGNSETCMFLSLSNTSTGTLNCTGNTGNDLDDQLLFLTASETTDLTAVLTNNTVSSNDTVCFELAQFGSSTSAIALRNNNLTTSGSDAILINTNDVLTLCLDALGNTLNNGDFRINGNGNAVLDIERFDGGTGGPLDDAAVNTFANGAVLVVNQGGASVFNPRPAGFCNIP